MIAIAEQEVGEFQIVRRANVNTVDMGDDVDSWGEFHHEGPQVVVERTFVRLGHVAELGEHGGTITEQVEHLFQAGWRRLWRNGEHR